MKKSFNITTPEEIDEMFKKMKSNEISIYVMNQSELYCKLETLCKMCVKKFKKYNGLDINYLANCSTMKAITRTARHELLNYDKRQTMLEDEEARNTLALYVHDYCKYEGAQ